MVLVTNFYHITYAFLVVGNLSDEAKFAYAMLLLSSESDMMTNIEQII